jgi:hypothetical protein
MKLFVLALLMVSVMLAAVIVAAHQDDTDIQALIDNAMSAAPLSIAQDATIVDWVTDADGKFVVLREGTNDWTCFPDDLNTPMNNPMCFDPVWMVWFYAALAGEDPTLTVTVPGFAYMLQGDDAASNFDPTLTEPAAGEHRMEAGPHIMILLPASVDLSGLSTDDHSGNSWVMWANTPMQHIMVPVADMADMPGMDS